MPQTLPLRYVEDKQGNRYLPITHVHAVRDSNGNTLDAILDNLQLAVAPVTSVNSKIGAVVLDKTDIGLSQVDNTKDVDKEVKHSNTTGKLKVAVNIWGQSFDGSSDITGAFTYQNIKIENNNQINAATTALYLQQTSAQDILMCGGGGKVGIGTTTLTYKLNVNGSIFSNGFVKDGSDDIHVLLGGGGHKALSDFVQTTGDQSISGTKTFNNSIISTVADAFRINRTNYGVIFRHDDSSFHILLTANGTPTGTYNNLRPFSIDLSTGDLTTQAITSTDYVSATNGFKKGTLGDTYVLLAGGGASKISDLQVSAATKITVTNSDANATYRLVWHSSNDLYSTGGIYCNPGTDCIYASHYYETSDRAKKTNIEYFSEHIRKFTLKESGKQAYGVIAQEVAEMFREGEDGNMTVNYSSVLSYYVGQLENRIKVLEEEIQKLKMK